MARMHSGAKGKSGSKKPAKRVPSWAPFKENEVEKLIVKYAKAEKSASEIGLILRDNYGIHSIKALTGKKVTSILQEQNLGKPLPDDLLALIRRLNELKKHLEANKHDGSAKRGLILTESKVRGMIKYYKNTGKLPQDWTLDMERLKMYLG
ncbi:30S ribosomal protein S15 [Candidatus Woesearchaeota archaeon]|nr:30S ribosomal protein S15 [Candidatus Woesearchaeota archaeon]